MKQNINIEAEGNELILKNKAGDYVIIPKKYRLEVQDMIKNGCYGCIDALVETLPVMEDYAEDGSLLPDWDKVKSVLNPKNWGVNDYTDKGDFNTAYNSARQAGKKEFMWNNKRFSTTMKNLPGERIRERDDFQGTIFTRPEKIGDNSKHGDLFNYYKGQPLVSETHNLQVSKYRPDDETNTNSKYISIQDDDFKDAIVYYVNNYYKHTGKANRPSYSRKPEGGIDENLNP